jgi:hypothetical protein
MGRTACTEPQCLYSRAIPLLSLWALRPVQNLSACTRVNFSLPYIHLQTDIYIFKSTGSLWTNCVHGVATGLKASYHKPVRLNVRFEVFSLWSNRITVYIMRRWIICTPQPIMSSDKIEKNELGGACSAYGGEERRIQGFGRESWGKESTWKTQA